MTTLTIYADPCTVNCHKVLAGLELIDVPFKLEFVDFFKGQQKDPEHVARNPNAALPYAVHDDLVITESNAILQYACDANNKDAYYPKDPKVRAKVNQWLLWDASTFFKSCYVVLVENVVKPLLGATPDQAILDGEMPRWNKLAKMLDDQLDKTKFLVGDHITIADIAVASCLHLWEDAKMPFEKHPNLHRWYTKEIESLPAWQHTQPAVEKALVPNKKRGAVNGSGSTGNIKSVKALFNYTRDDKGLTELYFYDHPEAGKCHEPGDDPREVEVHDGWDRAASFTVDTSGFALDNFQTGFTAWEEDAQVRKQFYPEVVDYLKKKLGATRVLVFDHTIRTKANVAKKLTDESNVTQRSPVRLVHCDYTSESAPTRVRQLLPDEADDLLSRRVAFINVWKPIHRKVEEFPLAMCDVDTSPKEDFFKLYLRYRDRTGENFVMRHNKAHKWIYFPDMTPEQIILLKTYDSKEDVARFVGHSAFEDPTSKPDAPARESVEIRTICFY